MRPASLVAWRCASLKYAGTVMTASVTLLAEVLLGGALQLHEDARRDLRRRVALAADLDGRVAVGRAHDLVRDALRPLPATSSNLRPMKRLIE